MNQIVLIVVFCVLFVSSCNYINPIPFDSKIWKEANIIKNNYSVNSRPGMARDLINRNLLIGKSPQEIEELLGEPESKNQNTYSYKTEEAFNYIEPQKLEILDITFDKNNRVEKVEVRTIKF